VINEPLPQSATSVTTGLPVRLCSKCGMRERDKQQRWCRECRTAHRRKSRLLARTRRSALSVAPVAQQWREGRPAGRQQMRGAATDSSRRTSHGGGVRLAALEDAASTLLNELTPTAQSVVVEVAERARVDLWIAVLGGLERYAELVLTPAPRST